VGHNRAQSDPTARTSTNLVILSEEKNPLLHHRAERDPRIALPSPIAQTPLLTSPKVEIVRKDAAQAPA
jgi:hypothetical protein